ncbi:alpha/beta fold hydrolase [Kitasatospora sp. NPDC093806]|uniref:alpha/beta fold hydrolase n=1 Tax=Kitasatospora sp. NPDC093806 TaxID=3155075 RepID=UPI003429DEA1
MQQREEIIGFEYGGFGYRCRVVHHESPSVEPILIVGGVFQDVHSWRYHEPALTAAATLIVLEPPGLGSSDPLPPEYGLDFLADAVEHAVDRLGHPALNVVGLSYGAMIVHRLAQRSPGRLARLALCGAAAEVPAGPLADLADGLAVIERGEVARFAEWAVDLLSPVHHWAADRRTRHVSHLVRTQLAASDEQSVLRIIQNCRRTRINPLIVDAPTPDIPVLVFNGAHDAVAPPDSGRRLAETYRHGRFVAVGGTDHFMPLQRPRAFTEILDRHFHDQPVTDLPYLTHPASTSTG